MPDNKEKKPLIITIGRINKDSMWFHIDDQASVENPYAFISRIEGKRRELGEYPYMADSIYMSHTVRSFSLESNIYTDRYTLKIEKYSQDDFNKDRMIPNVIEIIKEVFGDGLKIKVYKQGKNGVRVRYNPGVKS
jgi:hypothetical protein